MANTKGVFALPALLLLLGSALLTGCSAPDTGRVYPCYRLRASPSLDGVVRNDPAWGNIPAETGFMTVFIETFGLHYPPSQQTTFKMGYDSTHLYVAVECEEPWIRYLKAGAAEEAVFTKDDGIELLLRPALASAYHHFIVNALGSRSSEAEGALKPVPASDWEAVTRLGSESYTVELAIPFSKLGGMPAAGELWRGNIGRNIITINCPENRQTSWSPVQSEFDEVDHFGSFVFKDRILSSGEAAAEEKRLKAMSDDMLRHTEEALAELQAKQENLAQLYRGKVRGNARGVTDVTRGEADLIEPPDTPAGEVWRYGLGFPMQISPTEAALLTNIRMEGSGNIDFEIGTDAIVFRDLAKITAEQAIPVSRYEKGIDRSGMKFIVRKGPVLGGFIPLGARLVDGSKHPHAGTGFGLCWAISHRVDEEGRFDYLDILERYAMMFQFSYDGRTFRVVRKERVDAARLLPDWKLAGNFITNAIPDGEDLLYVMIARSGEIAVAGVTRWQYEKDRWHPVSFVPVTGNEVTWSEPSLIRETDGSLLFSARSSDRAVPTIAFDIGVWRSRDNGRTWKQVIHEKNRRSRSPVSINRTVDGTPYIAANTPPLRRTREVLCLWPIDETRTKLECRLVARDARAEFGPAPSGSWWRIDHPTSAVIRLADGAWHSVLSYRIVDNGEVEGDAPPAPQTGCYVEEVLSAGAEQPVWIFHDEVD